MTTPSQADYAHPGRGILHQRRRPAAAGLSPKRRPASCPPVPFEYAGVHGTPRTLYNPRYIYFQPRVGFAYRFHPDTVHPWRPGPLCSGQLRHGQPDGVQRHHNYTATSDNFYHPYTNPTTGSVSSLFNPYPGWPDAPTGNSLGRADQYRLRDRLHRPASTGAFMWMKRAQACSSR